jgi:hypothetical protein
VFVVLVRVTVFVVLMCVGGDQTGSTVRRTSCNRPQPTPTDQTPKQVLGRGGEADRARNLAAVLDGYFLKGGHHINVNVSTVGWSVGLGRLW